MKQWEFEIKVLREELEMSKPEIRDKLNEPTGTSHYQWYITSMPSGAHLLHLPKVSHSSDLQKQNRSSEYAGWNRGPDCSHIR